MPVLCIFAPEPLLPAPRRRRDRRAAAAYTVFFLSLLSTGMACNSAVKCTSDASCPAGASCSADYGVCFERLTFTRDLVAGDSHTCAGTTAGGVKCWGANGDGRLGDGTVQDRPVPTPVSDQNGELLHVKLAAAGSYHSCALIEDGRVQCWGWNQSGQVSGLPTAGNVTRPATVLAFSGLTALGLGQAHSCALTAARWVKCWGDNSQGQVGPWAVSADPPLLTTAGNFVALASGNAHACAITQDKRLFCWGSNTDGQANWRVTDRKPAPSTDLGLAGVESVAAGQSHTCVVTSDQNVLCWGANDKGQLGRVTGADPTSKPSLAGARSVAAGCNHTCALKMDGTVSCWGSNAFGELGTGSTFDGPTTTPGQVSQLAGVEAIAAGCRHTCAYVKGGAVWCWGDGTRGQLGDGARQSRSTPGVVEFSQGG